MALKRITRLPDEPFFDVMPQLPGRRTSFTSTTASWKPRLPTSADASSIASKLLRLAPPCGNPVRFDRDPSWTGHRNDLLQRLRPEANLDLPHAQGGRADQSLPTATHRPTDRGPSYFAALVTMDLLEVSLQPSLLSVLVAGGKAWVGSYADDTGLWVEHGIGRRVCSWIDRVRQSAPEALSSDKPERQNIDVILAAAGSPRCS